MSNIIVPEYLVYLDEVLLFLRDSAFNKEVTIVELYKGLTGLDFNHNINPNLLITEITIDNKIKSHGTFYSQQKKLEDSIEFLVNEGLVKLTGINITLSSKGLVKTYIGNFSDDYKEKENLKKVNSDHIKIQNMGIWASIIISFTSLLVTLLIGTCK